MEARAAITFIIAQTLFKIIFEFQGAKIFSQSHPLPAFTIIVIFTIAWATLCLLCLANITKTCQILLADYPFQKTKRPYFPRQVE